MQTIGMQSVASTTRSRRALAERDHGLYLRGMERLVDTIGKLSLARDLQTVQEIVRTAARELTGADGASFVLRDNDHCYYADEDAIEPLWKGKRFPMSLCVSGWVMLNQQAVMIEDIYDDPRVPVEAYRPTFVKSLAMVPIRTASPIGAIGNYWAKRHRPTRNEMQLLKTLANTTAVALENIEVYATLDAKVRRRTEALQRAHDQIRRLAYTDDLTSVYNRRGFLLMAESELRHCRESGIAAQLLYMDLNGLKLVNDRIGHEAGDAMIVRFAQALRGCMRDGDVLGRVGGDEFCVLARAAEQDGSSIVRRLQAALADAKAAADGPVLSASIGVIDVNSHPQASLEKLISLADAAMYADKRSSKTGDS